MWYWIIMFRLPPDVRYAGGDIYKYKKQKAENPHPPEGPQSGRGSRPQRGGADRSSQTQAGPSAFAGTGRPAESAGKKTKKKEKETVENYSRGYRQLGKVQFHIL